MTIAQFIDNEYVHKIADLFTMGTPLQTALYALLIFLSLLYFYTAISINITDMADNMKNTVVLSQVFVRVNQLLIMWIT